MLPIAILASLLVVAAGFAVASFRALAGVTLLSDMPARRRFLAAFDGDAVPANVLVETYEALGRRLAGGGARVTRTARLSEDLGLTAADVEDVALLVTARCGGRILHANDLDALDASARTVGDLVAFVTPFCVVPTGRAHLALMA